METTELLQIQSLFKDLSDKIDKLSQHKIVVPEPSRSSDISELTTALAKAQHEMRIARLNKLNAYRKTPYADIVSNIEASRQQLTNHGLSTSQQLLYLDDGQLLLLTTLWHSSGQWISSRIRVTPSKNDVQTLDSHVTLLKRMCYTALIGVVTEDEDDNGEYAVATSRETFALGVATNHEYDAKKESYEVVNPTELRELEYELQGYPDICKEVLEALKINSLADMPKSRYRQDIEQIRRLKKLREGK